MKETAKKATPAKKSAKKTTPTAMTAKAEKGYAAVKAKKTGAVKTATKAPAPAKPVKAATKKTTPKKKTAPSAALQPATHEAIAKLAHHYWTQRGGTHGYHEEDWYRAEHELLGKAS